MVNVFLEHAMKDLLVDRTIIIYEVVIAVQWQSCKDSKIITWPLIKPLSMSLKAVNDASRPRIEDSLETKKILANAMI